MNTQINKTHDNSDLWSVYTMTDADGEYLMRFNTGLWKIIEDKRYPYQVGIAMKLNQPSNGFPHGEENYQLLTIEDRVSDELEKEGICLFAGIITGGGIKEFVLYTAKPEIVSKKFEFIKNEIKTHDLQLNIQEDREWEVFKTFCPKPDKME